MAYTTIDNPELHFQTKLYTGDGNSNQTITFDGSENMQPDWVWIKLRSSAHQHTLIDSVRGVNKALLSNSNVSEDTDDQYGWLSSFNTNGFTTQDGSASAHWNVNKTSETYVSWNWKAGGSASSNSNGSITTSVSANTTAGFSIVSWTGNGTDGASIGHGLVNPNLCIIKRRDASGHGWFTGGYPNTSLFANDGDHLNLESTGALSNSSTKEIDLSTDSGTTCTFVDAGNDINLSSGSFIGYFFKNIKGYSKVGSYTGNGNADGTFVYTGFKPAWVMIKNISTSDPWLMLDNKRDTFNPMEKRLDADDSDAEATGTDYADFLSNGFKIIGNLGIHNNSNQNYLFIAFAESPFVNSNGVPNNAR